LLLDHAALSVTVGLAGFIALLVLGTQVLDWYWPVLLLAVTLAFGWFRVRGSVPSAYRVAQAMDRRLESHDLLSTAYHYSEGHPRLTPDEGVVASVTRLADRKAGEVELTSAVPLHVPKNVWPAAVLTLVAAGLFVVRYGVLHTMDLDAPLVEIRLDTITGVPEKLFAKTQQKQVTIPGESPDTFNVPVEGGDKTKSNEDTPDSALDSPETPDGERSGLTEQTLSNTKQGEADKQGNETGESVDGKQEGQQGEKGSGEKGSNDQAKSGQKSDQKGNQQGSKEANSMLDKMRDAFANLMDKLKSQSQSGESKQTASAKEQQKGSGQQQAQQKGMPSRNQTPENDPSGDPNGDQQGEQSEDAQGQKSSQGDKAAEQQAKDSKSGMGKQDGKKDTELAEQLEAMGKISEILGKRSQSLTGEMMVEVSSSKQQLKTPYMNRKATHAEAGGEINRDEVPLHLQPFVRQYYEAVRKGQNTAPSAPKKE